MIDWVHWFTSLRVEDLALILGFVLLVDGSRYALGSLLMAAWDAFLSLGRQMTVRRVPRTYSHCPSICVLLVGHNEGDTIASGLESIWGMYPRMEIIVVDDGSTDGMAERAREFARDHDGVLVLSRGERGGKSSALNWGLRYTRAEIVVCVDTDSRLSETSLWEIVQPFEDPEVGAVSATVEAWNAFHNVCSWLQAYEYRQTIFLGRMLQQRLGMLAIVSGAFGAFRRPLLEQLGGWDVGPGEDGDLTLRIRKAGFRVTVAPWARCLTNVPVRWMRLFHQRRRWDRTVITFECRKHLDMSFGWQRHFRWTNFSMLAERWFFNVAFVFTFWGYAFWMLPQFSSRLVEVLVLIYLTQLLLELVQVGVLLAYTKTPARDLMVSLVVPFYPLYQVFLKGSDLVAILEEVFLRKSRDDNFVPLKVRQVARRW